MAWMCSAGTNEALIANLVKNELVKTEAVAAAMRTVDRAWFTPSARDAYEDAPQPIGHHVTISAPHMHAIMLEILAPYIRQHANRPDAPLRVLDVGSGSGYLTAVLAALCEATTPQWQVFGIEHVKELQERSVQVIAEHWPAWVRTNKVRIFHGDGRNPTPALQDAASGTPSAGTDATLFDLIHVGAAAETVPPALVALLKKGGCMVIPVGAQGATQQLLACQRGADGEVSITRNCLVSFVPLTSLETQQRQGR